MSFDFVKFADHYKSQFYEFYLDPDGWRKFSTPHSLAWKKVRFSETNRSLIPTQRGIYAFTVEHAPSKFPGHGYILYLGISGDTSASNLRRRYGQYLLNQKTGKGRPRVAYMLQKWPDDLFFSYCPLPDAAVDLAELETSLLGTLSPPINQKDFPAKIAAARKAKF
jgi:hypothetical protein